MTCSTSSTRRSLSYWKRAFPRAVIVSDGGPDGRSIVGFRNLKDPLTGAAHVAAFVVAATQRAAPILKWEERELNGQPAIVFYEGERHLSYGGVGRV